MNLLQELLLLSEAPKGKSLIGLTINGKKITDKTASEPWPGDFDCRGNQLTTLKGAPASVGGYFWCSRNQLTSLEGAPSSVGGYFSCSDNQLTTLEGAPASVGGNFYCGNNKLTTLKDIHKIVKQMNGAFYEHSNLLKSHVLGLLLVKGCKEVVLDNNVVKEILNRYLPNTRGNKALLECQSELLDADLEDWAQL